MKLSIEFHTSRIGCTYYITMHHDMSLLLRKTWQKIAFQLQVHNELLRSIQMNVVPKLVRQEGHIHNKIH